MIERLIEIKVLLSVALTSLPRAKLMIRQYLEMSHVERMKNPLEFW